MANYSSKFIRNYATSTALFRELTRKNTRFTWTSKHQAAYETVMNHFDISKETSVLVDASPVGLSAILTQKDPNQKSSNVIAYASRALSPAEQRYSQTEKEALGIVWGIEHFHMNLFGTPFTLITDHKPLQLIYNNPRSRPPARIERWFLRLQQYDFHVIYRAGKENPANFLSRHPQPKIPYHNMAEEYINFIWRNTAQAATPVDVIKAHTSTDPSFNAVRQAVVSGDWYSDKVKSFINIKDEIAVDITNEILLRGTRIVIPTILQSSIVKLAHKDHIKDLQKQKPCYVNMYGSHISIKQRRMKLKHVYLAKLMDRLTHQNRY